MPQFCLLFYAILQSRRPKRGAWHNAPPKYAPGCARQCYEKTEIDEILTFVTYYFYHLWHFNWGKEQASCPLLLATLMLPTLMRRSLTKLNFLRLFLGNAFNESCSSDNVEFAKGSRFDSRKHDGSQYRCVCYATGCIRIVCTRSSGPTPSPPTLAVSEIEEDDPNEIIGEIPVVEHPVVIQPSVSLPEITVTNPSIYSSIIK